MVVVVVVVVHSSEVAVSSEVLSRTEGSFLFMLACFPQFSALSP